jgi:hypothetical protein
VIPFAPDLTVDQVGIATVAGVATMTAAHGAASYARQRILDARKRRAALRPVVVEPEAPTLGAEPQIDTLEPGLALAIEPPSGVQPAVAAEAAHADAVDPIDPAELDPARLDLPERSAPDLAGPLQPAEGQDGVTGSSASPSRQEPG